MDRAKSIVSKNDKSRAERKVKRVGVVQAKLEFQGTSQRVMDA